MVVPWRQIDRVELLTALKSDGGLLRDRFPTHVTELASWLEASTTDDKITFDQFFEIAAQALSRTWRSLCHRALLHVAVVVGRLAGVDSMVVLMCARCLMCSAGWPLRKQTCTKTVACGAVEMVCAEQSDERRNEKEEENNNANVVLFCSFIHSFIHSFTRSSTTQGRGNTSRRHTTWDDHILGDKCQADVASSTPKHAEVLNSVGGAHHLQVVLLRASKPTK